MNDMPDLPELPDAPPPGPAPVVLLHGAGQMPTMWQSQVEALGAGTKAIAPWIEGMRPGRRHDVSLTEASAALLSTFELNGIKRARVVAHQFGAMVALQTAADAPDRIERMVISGAVVLPGRVALAVQKALVKFVPATQLAEAGVTRDALLQALDVMAHADFSARLGSINTPTLVVCCEGDQAGRAYAGMLAERMPNAELRLVPGSSSAPMAAAPDIYNALMTRFLGTSPNESNDPDPRDAS